MKACAIGISALFLSTALYGFQSSDQIRKMEASGETEEARAALQRAADTHPNDISALTEYAEFLDRYGDPGSRAAYRKLLSRLQQNGDSGRAATVSRRLAALDLLAADKEAAERDLAAYSSLAGKPRKLAGAAGAQGWPTVPLAGPLRSFARMAAIPPDITPEEILPAVARNVVTNGYQASRGNEELEPTEYLKLLRRYISQAKELEHLAGDKKAIEIPACDSPNTGDLLRILGFRMRGGCGSDVVLETVNERRAFITTDSGFPVNDLEQALRTNRPFTYAYQPTAVPVMFGPDYWMGGKDAKDKDRDPADFVDSFISDPATCRLYLGFSKLDRDTAESIRKASTFVRLRAYSNVLDFFGGMFEVRGGKAVVPGGPRSASAWADLVGANPDQGGAFFDKMIAKDDGWVASLYDALARIRGPVRDYLVEPAHMKRFYSAIRGRLTSPGPARPVFRSNADMMLLTTRLRLDPNGKPHIPGNLEVWKTLFTNHPQGKYDAKLTRLAAWWKDPDDVVEALFALCRKSVENEPLKIFMALTDLDRNRAKPLEPATVDRLARSFRTYGSQYPIFAESRDLSDASINQFLDTADALTKIREQDLRADAAGTFQSLVSLWQIFVRQQTLPAAKADATFAGLGSAFGKIRSYRDLFDAGRDGVSLLLAAVPGAAARNNPQEQIIDLLGGAATSNTGEARDQAVQEIMRILDAQRIVSLDTLFQLAGHLVSVSQGGKLDTSLVAKLSGRISEIQLPRAALSDTEKNVISFGYWSEKHIDTERRLNPRATIEKAGNDPEKLKDIRGLLAPLMRDTLVAFNYAYYAPPGSQVLYTNPVFVRSHDFIGAQGVNHTWRATELSGSGWPTSGGGRLIGSLATLPYALAEAEQNFLVPAQTQALIWGDLVPQMILSAKIPRWWNVTPSQLHWVGLHVRYGRELLAEAAFDPELRAQVLEALGQLAAPARTREIGALIEQGEVKSAVERVTPSELFLLAREVSAQRSDDSSALGAEIRQLAENSPKDINYEAISREFGTPKPTLANSYEPELLNLRTFPTLMGYSSRIMAESWESNTLYWAALADELSLPPAELNVRIPEWTQQLVEHIFASHLDDWPAVLKSLRLVGDDVRSKTRAALARDGKASALLESPPR